MTLAVHAPFDGALLGHAPVSDSDTIERALATAHALFRDRDAWLSASERIAVLHRAAALIDGRREALALQVARESGKPLRDARTEIARGIDGIAIAIEQLRSRAGQVVPMGLDATSGARLAFTQYEPIGPVFAISAFNHPFNLVIHQVVPAVAVGAPVIVKPSPKTPLSCGAVIDILTEAGLPPGWATMILPASDAQTADIVCDPRLGFVSFIGSAAVGWRLRGMLAPGTRCALEHGGIAPVIVARDADLDAVVPRLARAGFWHAGQACVSVQRVFCERAIARDIARRLAVEGATLRVGDPSDPSTDVGPLITRAEVDRIASWVDAARAAGAELIGGGERISASCYAPTVLLDPPDDADVACRELFGPVIVVHSIDTLDEGIARANATPFAFQAAVCTRALDTALHCARRLDATAVMINESTLFRVDWMPFAGARQSGHGVGGIPDTMREMQTEKMIVWRSDALAQGITT